MGMRMEFIMPFVYAYKSLYIGFMIPSWLRQWFVRWFGIPAIELWFRSLRLQSEIPVIPTPAIIGFWHEDIFAALAFLKFRRMMQACQALVSPSTDGDLLCLLLTRLGARCTRGSSHEMAGRAMRDLLDRIREGRIVLITPDGPTGPPRVMKPGMETLSRWSGAPIVFLTFEYDSYWKLGSWDSARIPKPCSRCRIKAKELADDDRGTTISGPMAVPDHGH